MKILIVDGDPSSHTVIAEILTKRGCRLLEVNGSEEALRIAHEEKPEIAIVDMLTPKLDRGEFVRQLRRDPAIARMPVIFYTDGYLEIASGLARDGDSLLTPMLLCEEAIRGKAMAEHNGSVVCSNGNGKRARNGAESAQEIFTFANGVDKERALIKPGDLITEIVDERTQDISEIDPNHQRLFGGSVADRRRSSATAQGFHQPSSSMPAKPCPRVARSSFGRAISTSINTTPP